jgi:hypothetical protein
VFYTKIVDHGADAGAISHQSLARWWHPLAFSETQDVLHRVIHPTLYRRTRMVTNIASNLPVFFVVVNFDYSHNRRQRPCYGHNNLKLS